MYTTLITSAFSLLFMLIKWVAEKRAGKKLTDKEFIEHIRVHQEKRKNVANQAKDFEVNLKDLYKKIQEGKDGDQE